VLARPAWLQASPSSLPTAATQPWSSPPTLPTLLATRSPRCESPVPFAFPPSESCRARTFSLEEFSSGHSFSRFCGVKIGYVVVVADQVSVGFRIWGVERLCLWKVLICRSMPWRFILLFRASWSCTDWLSLPVA
jgi:hypothetical protein